MLPPSYEPSAGRGLHDGDIRAMYHDTKRILFVTLLCRMEPYVHMYPVHTGGRFWQCRRHRLE